MSAPAATPPAAQAAPPAVAVRALVDQSFCLALIGRRDPQLQAMVVAHAPGTLGISAITTAALHLRAARSAQPEQNRRALAQFLVPLVAVEFDSTAALALASLEQSPLGREGRSSEALMVAAQALERNAAILTCAPLQYAGLPGVRVQTPPVLPLADAVPASQQTAPSLPATADSETRGLILALGSHDLTLDLVGERLHALQPGLLFCTSHVGSMDGLLALRRGEAHLAGAHLLDEATGEYNVHQARQVLGGAGLHGVVVGFVERVQGLIVAGGNPRAIHTIADLAREDVVYANRQPGAGTRALLDYLLRVNGLRPEQVRGYANEHASHTGVTAAIAAGAADCGMGIQAAAAAQGLGFVPLFHERYDLVIPAEQAAGPLLAPLFALLRAPDRELLRAIEALGGYSTAGMGVVRATF